MIQGKLRLALTLVVGLVAPAPVHSQVYWESMAKGGPMTGGMLSKTFAMPGRFKHVSVENERSMIVRLDQKMLYMVDAKGKRYAALTFDEMEAEMKRAGAKMDDAMAKMEKELKDMPPEQRAMMEKMMGGMMKGKSSTIPVTVAPSGNSKSVGRFRCAEYVVTRGNDTLITAWTTTEIKEFDALRKDWEQYYRRMMAMNPKVGGDLVEAFQKIRGFPMETRMFGITQTVTKVERRDISASEFEVPSGLKKVDKKEFFGTGEDDEGGVE